MPEGHISHRNALRLGAALIGTPLCAIEVGPQIAAQRMERRLVDDIVVAVDPDGKHLLLRFASGRVLHSHLGMNGRWRVQPAGAALSRGGLWLALRTADHVVAQYRGPRLHLYEPGEAIMPTARVGPDLLDATQDPGQSMVAALSRATGGVTIGEALLDQRLIGGIGNVYRAEVLFLCAIDPWRAIEAITADEAREIGQTASSLMRDGVTRPGPITTYHPPTPSRGERTWVYGRAGRPCRRCATPIASRGMGDANRTLYWCPTCQHSPTTNASGRRDKH